MDVERAKATVEAYRKWRMHQLIANGVGISGIPGIKEACQKAADRLLSEPDLTAAPGWPFTEDEARLIWNRREPAADYQI